MSFLRGQKPYCYLCRFLRLWKQRSLCTSITSFSLGWNNEKTWVNRWPTGQFSHLPQPSHFTKTGEGFNTNAFWAEKWVSFLADNEPCLFTDLSSSRCFLKKSKGGGQLHHHTNSHLAQAVKYVCGKHLKCTLAIQQTRTAQLEESRIITILVTVVLRSQITGPPPPSLSLSTWLQD